MASRDNDKITLPTNTTHITTWRKYVQKIKDKQPILRPSCECLLADGKSTRSRIGDLEKFGLLEIIDNYVYVTELGLELLSLFDSDGNPIANELEKTATMLKIFRTWHATNGGRDIHPGCIIIKLLDDPLMNGCITDHELAYFVTNKIFKYDSQYDEIRDYILDFRNNTDGLCIAKTKSSKSYIFLPTFVSDWEIFEKILDIAIKYDVGTGKFSLS